MRAIVCNDLILKEAVFVGERDDTISGSLTDGPRLIRYRQDPVS